MAQTVQLLPQARSWYRKMLGSTGLDKPLRWIVESGVALYASAKGFAFPKKFSWEWKLEMLLGRYESETTTLFKEIIHPGSVILDIGAHIGYFTRLFSSLAGPGGRVYAFEADPDNMALLKKNTSHARNVSLIHQAVAAQSGTLDFYHMKGSTGQHSLIRPIEASQKISVSATSIDEFLKSAGVSSVDIIKMDIEGAEPEALKGMQTMLKQNPHSMLVTEFNPDALKQGGRDPIAYLAQLEASGLHLFAITEDGLVPVTSQNIFSQLKNFHRTGYINLLCKQ